MWKDVSEAILAFNVYNELMIARPGKLQNNDPDRLDLWTSWEYEEGSWELGQSLSFLQFLHPL